MSDADGGLVSVPVIKRPDAPETQVAKAKNYENTENEFDDPVLYSGAAAGAAPAAIPATPSQALPDDVGPEELPTSVNEAFRLKEEARVKSADAARFDTLAADSIQRRAIDEADRQIAADMDFRDAERARAKKYEKAIERAEEAETIAQVFDSAGKLFEDLKQYNSTIMAAAFAGAGKPELAVELVKAAQNQNYLAQRNAIDRANMRGKRADNALQRMREIAGDERSGDLLYRQMTQQSTLKKLEAMNQMDLTAARRESVEAAILNTQADLELSKRDYIQRQMKLTGNPAELLRSSLDPRKDLKTGAAPRVKALKAQEDAAEAKRLQAEEDRRLEQSSGMRYGGFGSVAPGSKAAGKVSAGSPQAMAKSAPSSPPTPSSSGSDLASKRFKPAIDAVMQGKPVPSSIGVAAVTYGKSGKGATALYDKQKYEGQRLVNIEGTNYWAKGGEVDAKAAGDLKDTMALNKGLDDMLRAYNEFDMEVSKPRSERNYSKIAEAASRYKALSTSIGPMVYRKYSPGTITDRDQKTIEDNVPALSSFFSGITTAPAANLRAFADKIIDTDDFRQERSRLKGYIQAHAARAAGSAADVQSRAMVVPARLSEIKKPNGEVIPGYVIAR